MAGKNSALSHLQCKEAQQVSPPCLGAPRHVAFQDGHVHEIPKMSIPTAGGGKGHLS